MALSARALYHMPALARRPGRFTEVIKRLAQDAGLGNESDTAHLGVTEQTGQWDARMDVCQQHGPQMVGGGAAGRSVVQAAGAGTGAGFVGARFGDVVDQLLGVALGFAS